MIKNSTAPSNAKVLVAMSGGVDSSAAAALLLEQGYSCEGLYLQLLPGANATAAQPTSPAAGGAKAIAEQLGIPFHVLNFSKEFEAAVLRPFAESYLRGETPNPCAQCNKHIKFPAALAQADALGCGFVATGHYVKKEFDGRHQLRRAADSHKDQSYFLYSLTQEQLARTLFPLAGLTKAEVRGIAAAHGLCSAQRRESQDICFVPGGDYGAFLEGFLGTPFTPGNFVDPQGKVLGRHQGTPRYTLGQRKGLGLALPQPGYVLAIRPEENTVVVGEESALYTRAFTICDINLIAYPSLQRPVRCHVKVRYRQTAQPAIAEQLDDHTIRVCFDEPQRAITPGQAGVLYDGEYLIGGGTICP